MLSGVLALSLLLALQIPSAPQPQSAAGLKEAHTLIEQGKYADALALLHPLEAGAAPKGLQHEIGLAYYRQGDFANAQAAFAKAITENPEDREAVQLRGISLFQLGRSAEAIPLLKQVQTWTGEGSVESAYVLALAYIQARDYDNARQQAARMFNVAPDSAAAYLFTARLLLRGEHDEVEQYATKAAALDPKLPLAHFLLGEYYLFKSNAERAGENFRQELAINPGYAGTYDRLADLDTRLGKFDEAEQLLRRSILLDANSTGPYILMGKVQIKKQDYPQALLYLQRAARMDPNNYITHNLLGQAYRATGRTADAERELKLSEQLQSAQHPQFETPK